MNKQYMKEYHKQYGKKNREKLSEYRKNYYQNNKEKELEKNKKWLEEHPRYLKGYTKEYYIKNKEKISLQHKEWLEKNPEYKKEYDKQYRIKNKDKIILKSKEYNKTENGKASKQRGRIKRAIREKDIINTLTSQEWLNILEVYNYRCAYCGCEFEVENMPTKDHVIPISKGGHNVKENIVPTCQSCNSKKYNKILVGGIIACKRKYG